ncbi:MAG TPA: hypothetical protein VMW08_00530 [Acidimicrobiales bacterium]|nr:hypothetical protein [Acidimicrobiales bacterium]
MAPKTPRLVEVDPPPRGSSLPTGHDHPNLEAAVARSRKRTKMADLGEHPLAVDFDYHGHTEAELRMAFAAVVSDENWKLGVNACFPALNSDERKLVGDALIFYCGSPAEVYDVDGMVFVVAAGYYACIGS